MIEKVYHQLWCHSIDLESYFFVVSQQWYHKTSERVTISSKVRCFHIIMEIITIRDITIERVPSTNNIVDLLSKPFCHLIF